MIEPKLESALNEQLNKESYSAYLYLAMSAYFSSIDLDGFAHWMRIQAQEELVHAMKIYDFLLERDAKPVLMAIAEPKAQWESPRAVFEASYQHEQEITASINQLVNLALSEKDHATGAFLQWFVNEQVEEEANALRIINSLKLVGDSKSGLFMIDRELASRQIGGQEG